MSSGAKGHESSRSQGRGRETKGPSPTHNRRVEASDQGVDRVLNNVVKLLEEGRGRETKVQRVHTPLEIMVERGQEAQL